MKKILGVCLGFMLFAASTSMADEATPPATDLEKKNGNLLLAIQMDILTKDGEGVGDDAKKYANFLTDALKDPGFSAYTNGLNYGKYNYVKNHAEGPLQLSQVAADADVEMTFIVSVQNSILIQQNEQIIKLLEKIADKK